MQNLKHIKSFKFGYAKYLLSDGRGDDVELKVYYAKNYYSIKSLGSRSNNLFRSEIEVVAKELLGRKHGVNFANSVSK